MGAARHHARSPGTAPVATVGHRLRQPAAPSGDARPVPAPSRCPRWAAGGARTENPESVPGFDDSGWPAADRTTTNQHHRRPDGQPVLFADDYGFHYGDVWYRGAFTDADELESVSLGYSTGTQGLLMAWLDGEPLGTHRMPVPDKSTARKGSWAATATFDVPAEAADAPARMCCPCWCGGWRTTWTADAATPTRSPAG